MGQKRKRISSGGSVRLHEPRAKKGKLSSDKRRCSFIDDEASESNGVDNESSDFSDVHGTSVCTSINRQRKGTRFVKEWDESSDGDDVSF